MNLVKLDLFGVTEKLFITDFFELLKNGFIEKCGIEFAQNVSETYQKTFKAAIEDMKKNWTAETEFPFIIIF